MATYRIAGNLVDTNLKVASNGKTVLIEQGGDTIGVDAMELINFLMQSEELFSENGYLNKRGILISRKGE